MVGVGDAELAAATHQAIEVVVDDAVAHLKAGCCTPTAPCAQLSTIAETVALSAAADLTVVERHTVIARTGHWLASQRF